MKKFSTIAIAMLFIGFLTALPAQATWIQYQTSPADLYNRADLPVNYDLLSVSVGVDDSSPNEYYFYLNFNKPITPQQFADGKGSWAGVMLDINNDGKIDYSIETNTQSYSNNFYHDGQFMDRRLGTPQADRRCAVITWSNIISDAKWIGFRIQKACLNFDSIIGIQGYADYNSKDEATNDWAPDSIWEMSLSGGAVPSPTPTSTAATSNEEVIDAQQAAVKAKIVALESLVSFYTAKKDCLGASANFEDNSAIGLFDLTDLTSLCNQLDLEASSIDRKISALDPLSKKTTSSANVATDDANELAEAADALTARMQDISDEISLTETSLSKLGLVIAVFDEQETVIAQPWEALIDRLSILPVSMRASIIKSGDYKNAQGFTKQMATVINTKETLLKVLSGIKRPTQITPLIISLESLRAQLPQLKNYTKLISSIERKIPAFVCQKGSTVVAATKTGKCAKGYEALPTN